MVSVFDLDKCFVTNVCILTPLCAHSMVDGLNGLVKWMSLKVVDKLLQKV